MNAQLRNLNLDAARGLGIILVVFGHVERGLKAASIGDWSVVDFTVYTFHMPLFFVLAGLNAAHGVSRGAAAYLGPKVQTIVFPYVLWSLIQGAIMVMASGDTNAHRHWSDLAKIAWEPMDQFWFLYVLMIGQVLFVMLASQRAAIMALSAALLIASQFLEDNTLLQRMAFSLPWFWMAGLFGDQIIASARAARGAAWSVILSVVFAISVATCLVAGLMDFNAVSAWPATIAGIAATLVIAETLSGRLLKILAALGMASMTIYVMHIIAGSGARIILRKLHVPEDPIGYAAVCTIIGIAGPYAAHVVITRLRIAHLLGLAPWPKAQANKAIKNAPASA